MKIISHYKDYYDFVQGEYGIDPKAVYDRVCKDEKGVKSGIYVPPFLRPRPFFENAADADAYEEARKKTPATLYRLAICGHIYCVAEKNGKLFHGPRFWTKEQPEKDGLSWFPSELISKTLFHEGNTLGHLERTKLNEEHQCPVMLVEQKTIAYRPVQIVDALNPRLSDFQFAKVIPPKDMFLMLTNFLLKERPQPEREVNTKDKNDQRILAHGFDLKTSFRKGK